MQGSADIRDIAMPELMQVTHRIDDSPFVVEGDITHSGANVSEVQVHSRDSFFRQHLPYGGINLRRQNGEARHLQPNESPYAIERTLRIVVRVHDQSVHLVCESLILESSGYVREEWIAKV
jgi:hypothetical protein